MAQISAIKALVASEKGRPVESMEQWDDLLVLNALRLKSAPIR